MQSLDYDLTVTDGWLFITSKQDKTCEPWDISLSELEEVKENDLTYSQLKIKIKDIKSFHFELDFNEPFYNQILWFYQIAQKHSIPIFVRMRGNTYCSVDRDQMIFNVLYPEI